MLRMLCMLQTQPLLPAHRKLPGLYLTWSRKTEGIDWREDQWNYQPFDFLYLNILIKIIISIYLINTLINLASYYQFMGIWQLAIKFWDFFMCLYHPILTFGVLYLFQLFAVGLECLRLAVNLLRLAAVEPLEWLWMLGVMMLSAELDCLRLAVNSLEL